MLNPNSAGAGSRDAADAEAAFEWPPPDETVSDLFRFPDDSTVAAFPAAVAVPDEARARLMPPDGEGVADTSDDPEADPFGVAGAVWTAPAQPVDSPANQPYPHARRARPTIRNDSPVLGIWLRSHLSALILALLVLIAGFEGLYIVRQRWVAQPGSSPATTGSSSATPAPPAADATAGRAQAPPAAPVVSAPSMGRLDIRSEPSGAEVSIDGAAAGLTPVSLGGLSPGARHVALKLGGREVRQIVQVDPGATVSVIVPLLQPVKAPPAASLSGWVAIASPADLEIFENDVLVGSTRSPQLMMSAGPHTLRLVNEALGFSKTQQVRVEAGRTARVTVALPESTLHVNAQPWAEVWIDGKSVGETPIGNLAVSIGPHQILFRHPELGERTVSTTVRAGLPSRVAVDLRK